MRLLRLLPERWHPMAREIGKFGVVGGLNTVVDYAVFNLLLPIGPVKANVVSTMVATATSYGMNRHWTYRDRAKDAARREFVLFVAFNVVGLLIQSAVLGAAKYGLHFDEHHDKLELNIAKAVGIGVAMVFRFWAYRTFVFRTESGEEYLTGGEELAMALADATPSMAEDTHAEAHPPTRAPAPGDRGDQLFQELTSDLDGAEPVLDPVRRR